MKIFICAKNCDEHQNSDIESQADILCTELEKSGHTVEWSNQSHPVRLIMNKYDIIHILTETLPLSLKNYLLVVTAKTLGLPVVVTNYSVDNINFKSKQISMIQKIYFDALSVPEVGEIKSFRLFNQTKFILPAFFKQTEKQNVQSTGPTNIVFHIEKGFHELPDVKWDLTENIYINGTTMVGNLSKSQAQIRSQWHLFTKKNPIYKNAMLILNESNLKNLFFQNTSIFIVNYLKIQSIQFSKMIQMCLSTETVLVLNESQASGFPNLWCHGKNGIVRNFERSFSYQLSLTEIIEQSTTVQFEKKSDHFIEPKINELTRIYAKIKSEKELKISYANLSRRS